MPDTVLSPTAATSCRTDFEEALVNREPNVTAKGTQYLPGDLPARANVCKLKEGD